ncbi:MAG: RNA-binding protein [Pseudanabaenaceae cyanobacterium]
MSIRLYVGNLAPECDRQALEQIFHQSWDHLVLKLAMDRKTGKCRGFGFVTVETDELANAVIEKFNGLEFEGTSIKMEKALPRAKGKGEGKGESRSESKSSESKSEEGTGAGDQPRPRVPRPVKRHPVVTKAAVTLPESGTGEATATNPELRASEGEVAPAIAPPRVGGSSPRQKKSRDGRPGKDGAKAAYRESDSQPDPRWASELEQLKQRLLAAQS